MTCIVAFKHNNSVILAGDKMGSNGYTSRNFLRPKIFQNGDFYFGYTTSFYMGQLLQFNWDPPYRFPNENDDEYIFKSVVKSLSDMFESHNLGTSKAENDLEPERGSFIMVYKGRIFEVLSNMAILEVENFTSVGCGSEVMEGCIKMWYYLPPSNFEIEEVLTIAYDVVSQRSCGVSSEFDMLVINND